MSQIISEKSDLQIYLEQGIVAHFTPVQCLKKTSTGEVHLYRHEKTQKKLIVIHSKNHNDAVYRTLRQHKPEGLPQIYEVCSCENELWILEEYIEGENLASILKRGNLSKEQACKYTCQLCDALERLHTLNIIHRDIKPSNVIITPDDNAVLIDFNIARVGRTLLEQDTRPLGTVGYAAPEQFGFAQSGEATDVYALGVCLNVMLTGKHPSVEMPKGALHRILSKATTVEISKRYPTAASFKKALVHFTK